MNKPIKQHLIDPEICIRCYTCEMTCPENAIEHDDNNVVVNAETCNFCMACIPVCPTGSIDEWRVVETPYSLEEQYEWDELPEQEEFPSSADEADTSIEALDDPIAALLADAHKGAGGRAKAPASASKPTVNLHTISNPITAKVTGNYRLTGEAADNDVRHIILDFDGATFPVMEGQSIGITAPGVDANGKPHLPRLYSISSPRNGERPGFNNLALTVKREEGGVTSNFICDAKVGDEVQVTGPFGSTFLMPQDPQAKILMICTGTGSAPFRAFTMRRQRQQLSNAGDMILVFGARTPDGLPYFGPLQKLPDSLLQKHLVYSRVEGQAKEYVQDRLMAEEETIGAFITDPQAHVYVCGLRGMEDGVEKAFTNIAESVGVEWTGLRDTMRDEGRYHVETY